MDDFVCIAGVVPVMCNAMHNWLVGAALSSVQRMCMDDPRRIAGAAAAIRDQKKERTTNHGRAARKSACCAWCVKGNMSRERSEMTGVQRLCTSLRHLLEPFELRTAPCNPHPASRGLLCQCRLAQQQDTCRSCELRRSRRCHDLATNADSSPPCVHGSLRLPAQKTLRRVTLSERPTGSR